jgi:phage gp29-like protein
VAIKKKSGPDARRYRQLPVSSYYGWDNLGDVHATLTQLERGYFGEAARMLDAMGRDDRYRAVMQTRLNALQSVPLDMVPADDSDAAVKLADELGAKENTESKWDQMYSPAAVSKLLDWGVNLGIGLGEQVWYPSEDGSEWLPRLRVWHPQTLRWDETLQRYLILTADQGMVVLPDVHENTQSDGHWILFCPYGYHHAWLSGMVRSLAGTILDRTWNRHDWSRFNEKYGKPMEKAIVPANAPQDKKDAHFDGIANRHSETTVMCEQGTDDQGKPQGFDVELVESKSTGWDTFQARKKENDNDIAITLIGQNLTTEVVEGKGSLGVVGHEMVRRDYLKADAAVMLCLREQGLKHWARINYGNPDLAPKPTYRTDPPEDQVAVSTAKNNTVTMLATAKAASLPVDERAELDAAGVEMVSEEEQAAREALAREQAAAIAGGDGPNGPGGQDGGGDAPAGPGGGDPKAKPGKRGAFSAKRPKPEKRMFAGLPVAVENARGTTREWPGGSTTMKHDYGYIEGHVGADDEEVDVYLGPNEKAPWAYVVHQLKAPTYDKYDEDKVMLGFDSQEDAKRAYVAHRNDGEKAIKAISSMPMDAFHRQLRRRKGQGPIRASALIETRAALLKLVQRAGAERVALKGATAGKKLASAQRLTENGTRLAASALAPLLAAMRVEIKNATGFDDLQRRILERFKDADPATLAEAIYRTRMLAHFSGMLSAKKEIGA